MARIGERVPRITDDVLVSFTLPATTDEFTEKKLAKRLKEYNGWVFKRDKRTGELKCHAIVTGELDAVSSTIEVLQKIESALRLVKPMQISVTAGSMVTVAPVAKPKPSKKPAKKKLKVRK